MIEHKCKSGRGLVTIMLQENDQCPFCHYPNNKFKMLVKHDCVKTGESHYLFKNQICGFCYHMVPEKREILPTKDKREKFMRMVYDWADLSKDPRTKIGAVIIKDNVPISNGYNNFPSKVLDLKERYIDKPTKYSFIIHAEANAILNAARLGHSTLGATMFTQGIPCQECMKAVINSGIKKVICHKQWPNLTHSENWVKSIEVSETMRKEAGIELEWYDGVLDMEGFLDGKSIKI